MKYVLTLGLFLLYLTPLFAIAQKDSTIIYLDSSFLPTQQDKAVYKEVGVRADTIWPTVIIKLSDKSIVMKGDFLDAKLEFAQGPFEYFDNNILVLHGRYNKGKQVGLWERRKSNGQLIDSILFDEKGKKIVETQYSYFADGHVWEFKYENKATGETQSKTYSTTDSLSAESHYVFGDGETFSYYAGGKIKMHKIFKTNQLVSMEYYDETGKKYNEGEYRAMLTKSIPQAPDYPDGNDAFFKYIEDELRRGSLSHDDLKNYGTATVSFYLDEKGKPYDIKVSGSSQVAFSDALKRIIQGMPYWNMHGMKKFGPITRFIQFI